MFILTLSRVSKGRELYQFFLLKEGERWKDLASLIKPNFPWKICSFHINQSWMFGGESIQLFLCSDRIVCIVVGRVVRSGVRLETVVVFSH